MRMHRALSFLSAMSALALAACQAPDAPPYLREPEGGHALTELPQNAEIICVILDAGILPDWLVQGASGDKQRTRRIEVVQGHPVQLLLQPDADCHLEIPAMQVKLRGYADRFQIACFQPIKAGTYAIRIGYGNRQCDGELIVVRRDTP